MNGDPEVAVPPNNDKFDDHYPAQCPPEEAMGMEGLFHRFASENPEDLDDPSNYKTYAELDRFPNDPNLKCNACGLSGYLSLEELEKARRKLAKRFPEFANYPIYSLEFSVKDGVVKQTKSNNSKHHYTFWSYRFTVLISKRKAI